MYLNDESLRISEVTEVTEVSGRFVPGTMHDVYTFDFEAAFLQLLFVPRDALIEDNVCVCGWVGGDAAQRTLRLSSGSRASARSRIRTCRSATWSRRT